MHRLRLHVFARLIVLAVWACACSTVPLQPAESQLSAVCQGVAIQVALRVGGEPSTLIEQACVEQLKAAFAVHPELATLADAGR
jgi:hypothetical protein